MDADTRFRGVFALPVTPFDEKGELDEDSLYREIDFAVRARVHGIALPLIAGEFYSLLEEERTRIARIGVEAVHGRCPVAVSISAQCAKLALKFAEFAEKAGADAIISMPPYMGGIGFEGVVEYFRQLSRSISIPTIFQNPSDAFSPVLSCEEIIQLVSRVPAIQYVKDEGNPTGPRISRLVESGSRMIKGVFGGNGGRDFVAQLLRGAAGIMPACHVADVLVQVYEAFQKGEITKARQIHQDLMPLFVLDDSGLWIQISKAILVRRGVIRTATIRTLGIQELDPADIEEIEIALSRVQKWMTI